MTGLGRASLTVQTNRKISVKSVNACNSYSRMMIISEEKLKSWL